MPQPAPVRGLTRVATTAGGLLGRRPAPAQQTLTVARTPEQVAAALRDPQVLSRALGDAGHVEPDAGSTDGYRWLLTAGGGQATWRSRLVEEPSSAPGEPTTLRWTATARPRGREVTATLREAPNGLGTEVTLRLALPLPPGGHLAAGALAFTALYRLRALLQTGEVPTITPQPAARSGAR